ncbi:MAG: HisA/HisF-related TIM barrel protein [Candidatus Doudnabacteria bacterium]
MLLGNIRFNYAIDQSGIRNFDGNGYPYHRYLKGSGFSFDNCSFVAKTTTLDPRRGPAYCEGGNMPLRSDGMTPRELKPKCIFVSPRSFLLGVALNAVGLSGPGLTELLHKGIWHKLEKPFQISVMSVAGTMHERLQELRDMVWMIRQFRPFQVPFGIQLNISCPNVEHEDQIIAEKVRETKASAAILHSLRAPVIVKINTNFPIIAAFEISQDDNCAGFCSSNTIPWLEIPEADRVKMFGTTLSPLNHIKGAGGGGLSGAYLLPQVVKWVREARVAGIKKPIIAGGGILKPRDVNRLAEAGASAVAIGSVAFLRPWRVQRIINRANKLGRAGAFYER